METTSVNRKLILAGVIGVLVSTYALYVEMAVEARPGYKALCDFSPKASCTKVLSSDFAKGFGFVGKDSALKIPNCIFGTIFFCIMIYLSTFDSLLVVRLQLLLSFCSVGSCVYLAYLLIFVLKDFCVVCVTSYVVNLVIAKLTYDKLSILTSKKNN